MRVPGMLHAAPVLSPHPRAKVLAIDTSQRSAMPGVVRIFTAADVPGQRGTGLAIPDLPIFVAVGETTCCVGDILALVVADTPFHARQAAAKVKVDYEVYEPVTDPFAALEPDAPQVHAPGNLHVHPNLLDTTAFSRGDVDAALAASAHVIEQTFQTQPVEPAFLEPEACLAMPQGKGVKVFSQSQGSTFDQSQIARTLNLAPGRCGDRAGVERRRVRRERRALDSGADGAGGASARAPGEDGADAQAIDAASPQAPSDDAAATRSAPMPKAICWRCASASSATREATRAPAPNACCARPATPAAPIACPTWMSRRKAVFTNNPTSGAMRGFGSNQAQFAMEGIMDMLAEQVGVDGYDIRERNILNPGDAFATGQIMRESVRGYARAAWKR